MFDVHRHLAPLVDATKEYAKATSPHVRFLIAKNEHMGTELLAAKQSEYQVTTSTREELKKGIFHEVSSLKAII